MIRTATTAKSLDLIAWLLASLLIGAFAGSLAKQVGVAIEVRMLVFVVLAGIALAIWRVGRRTPDATAA
jgi:uncharacterized membrane protein YbjE (DUF340 family)